MEDTFRLKHKSHDVFSPLVSVAAPSHDNIMSVDLVVATNIRPGSYRCRHPA